ncbi:hypothetical protein [Pseudomonas pudica]|uniref:Transposase n=1 Tax=Pseudomonas pudica TaxID=272772 RepID=A0ABS0FW66_9PSED|nr:hypothetical protein [Pseudomonas pudica]MBF8644603.1 hypothetical protein [Pseudomonas pudica]MBF8759676.1 hypothetical protein [Pseudomonas pudica]
MYVEKTFTPQQLFEMVWERPVLIIAKEIGVSDVGLSKACRKAGITLPTRGHWAKPISKRPRRPKPPASTTPITFHVLNVEKAVRLKPENVIKDPRILIVPKELSDPHPLVNKWLGAARKAKELNSAVVLDKSKVLNSHISRNEVDRCALLYDSLIKASESLGYTWGIGSNGSFVRVDGEELLITIQERIKRFDIPPPPPRPTKPGQRWEPNFTAMRAARFGWEPTGVFSLIVDARSEVLIQKTWTDSKTGKLELKLGQILTGFVRIAASVKAQRLSDEASRRRWAEEERVRKEVIDQQRRLDKLRQNLMKNLESWERAQRLRAFIQATVEGSPPDEATQMALAMWVSWARQQVELLDPLKVDIPKVIDLSVELSSSGYGYWSSSKQDDDWWP